MNKLFIILLVCAFIIIMFVVYVIKCLNQNCSNCAYKNLCWRNTKDNYCNKYRCDNYTKEI